MVDKYLRAFMAHGQSSGLVQIAGVRVTPENEVKLRNSDVVQKLVVQLSCNSKMTHSRVHVGM